jgi:hypothetical protein
MEHLDPWLVAYQLRDLRPIIERMTAPVPPPYRTVMVTHYGFPSGTDVQERVPDVCPLSYVWCLSHLHVVYLAVHVDNCDGYKDDFCYSCYAQRWENRHSPTSHGTP